MITYKGLPAPIICDFLNREASKGIYGEDTTFQIGKIEMVSNTDTYLDAPFHRFEDGKDLSQLDLESLAHLEAVVFRITPDVRAIDASFFHQTDIPLEGKAVLVHTEWSRYWRTDQ